MNCILFYVQNKMKRSLNIVFKHIGAFYAQGHIMVTAIRSTFKLIT